MDNVIEVRDLTRLYGKFVAVDRVSFDVRRGEVFGFLGPNGAGKTTTVRMLAGYIEPTKGTALVDGHDILAEPTKARQHIGVVPEEANVYVDLTVWQNVMLMAELHGVPRVTRRQRARELLKLFGLCERAKQKGRALSKGFRQRLMICMALVSDPAILFLDEPTSGLDVASTCLIRELIVRMNRERDITIFLTTHNLEEADQLCQRVAIMNKGRIAAIDRPEFLRGAFESRRSVEVTFSGTPMGVSDLEELSTESDDEVELMETKNGIRVYSRNPGLMAQKIVSRANDEKVCIHSIRTLEPSLEDVFLHITSGSGARKELSHE